MMDFLKFMAGPEAQDLGKRATSFTETVEILLTEIRDELREHNARERAREENRGN
jgi:hypothetical protein